MFVQQSVSVKTQGILIHVNHVLSILGIQIDSQMMALHCQELLSAEMLIPQTFLIQAALLPIRLAITKSAEKFHCNGKLVFSNILRHHLMEKPMAPRDQSHEGGRHLEILAHSISFILATLVGHHQRI
nr:hypothetical protein [Tanacetum cinerariifolium]